LFKGVNQQGLDHHADIVAGNPSRFVEWLISHGAVIKGFLQDVVYAGHGRRILLKIVETRDAPLSQLKKAYLQKLVGNDTSQFAFESGALTAKSNICLSVGTEDSSTS